MRDFDVRWFRGGDGAGYKHGLEAARLKKSGEPGLGASHASDLLSFDVAKRCSALWPRCA